MDKMNSKPDISELRRHINELPLDSDDHSLREQAIAQLPKEIQEGARKLVESRKNANVLLDAMIVDLGRASVELKKNYEDQFWRRTAIRTLAATVDGIIFTLKELTHISGEFAGFKFNDSEIEFLRERKFDPGQGKPRLPGFKDNIKGTFELFAKAHNFSFSTDFGTEGFSALRDTYELRHGLMHPKSFETFCVTTEQTKRAGIAIKWLYDELNRLIDACSSQL